MRRNIRVLLIAMVVAFVCVSPGTLLAAANSESDLSEAPEKFSGDLADLSLEELMMVEVYSVSKKKQKLGESAAAVYILTQDDIRRSGATSIPELLRLVPGVEVARIDANTWAITARGFNDRFANKLLVLIDGRSVYTPLFAGVYWDVQDTLLEDIDRIEVIRGPGGAVWGANAVNGVINIITKSASSTTGALVAAGGGSEEKHFEALRYGAEVFDGAFLRVYGKYLDRSGSEFMNSGTLTDPSDEWSQGRGGFRLDWEVSERDTLTLQGDVYEGDQGSAVIDPQPSLPSPPAVPFTKDRQEQIDVAGGNIRGHWERRLDDGSDVQISAYYDRTRRHDTQFGEDRDMFDVELQHHRAFGNNHDVVWGVGYRLIMDDIDSDFPTSWSPSERTNDLFSAFVQDEISLLDDSLRVTLGSKVEHNDYTGFEFQPDARFLWKPAERQTLWGAVSRAVRSPSRSEDDIQIVSAVLPQAGLSPSLQPFIPLLPCPTCDVAITTNGSRSIDSESLLAFELGYRAQPLETVSFDLATYFNLYDDLRTITLDPADFVRTIGFDSANNLNQIRAFGGNFAEGKSLGVELAVDWYPTERQRFRSGYTFVDIRIDQKSPDKNNDGVDDLVFVLNDFEEGGSPQHQFFIRSLSDVSENVEFDMTVRWVDRIAAVDVASYWNLDVRLGWKPIAGLELAVIGQNLFEDSHAEYAASPFVSSFTGEVERGVYAKVTWSQ